MGRLLDESLGRLQLHFDQEWDPSTYRPRFRRPVTIPFAWKAAAAAVLLVGVGAISHPNLSRLMPAAHRAASAAHRPNQSRIAANLPGLQPVSSVVVYTSTTDSPVTETTYLGHLVWQGPQTDDMVSLNTPKGRRTVGFQASMPVWDSFGGQMDRIATAAVLPPLTGRWLRGGPTPLTSFSAAGSYAYVTAGAEWSVLSGPDSHWKAAPGANVVRTQIAALPNSPTDSMLLTEDAGGSQSLYVRSGLTAPWRPLALPGTPVLETVAVANDYWVLAGGAIRLWTPGHTWQSFYAPPKGFVVSSFAVSPNGSRIVVQLAPSGSQDGIGPLLLSSNAGQTWSTLPPLWPNGSAPSSLVLEPNGDVAAFLPGPPGLVEQYSVVAGTWTILPTPVPNSTGIGELAAYSNGNLLFSDASGQLYRYVQAKAAWQPLPPIPGGTGSQPPALLMGMGPDQAVVSGPQGWYMFEPLTAP